MDNDFRKRLENTRIAREAIVKAIKATGETHGTIPCPLCGNDLTYRQSGSRGHIHAHCETLYCVCWME